MHSPVRSTVIALVLALCSASAAVSAPDPSPCEILDRVESLLWSRTVQGHYAMTIVTPRWQRTLELRAWMERPRRSLIRIDAPAKEKGVGSLRIGAETWNYLPNVERTIKVPPSMLLLPWMGSDFTNDDLVKSGSLLDDYAQRIEREDDVDEAPARVIELTPTPDAAVVWGRILYWLRKADFMPLKQAFHDERGTLVRTMTFSEVRPMGNRLMPMRWEVRPADKPANLTAIVVKSAVYDRPIDPEIFTQRNLQKP